MSEMYYDRQGRPINQKRWAELFNPTYQRVAETTIDDVWVSTVWLGLDHSFGYGPPLIFETIVFGGICDESMARYTTEEAALAGHDQIVEEVKDAANLVGGVEEWLRNRK